MSLSKHLCHYLYNSLSTSLYISPPPSYLYQITCYIWLLRMFYRSDDMLLCLFLSLHLSLSISIFVYISVFVSIFLYILFISISLAISPTLYLTLWFEPLSISLYHSLHLYPHLSLYLSPIFPFLSSFVVYRAGREGFYKLYKLKC